MSIMALCHRVLFIQDRKREIEHQMAKGKNLIELQDELNRLDDEERKIIGKMGGA